MGGGTRATLNHSQYSKRLRQISVALIVLLALGMVWLIKNRTINNSSITPYVYVQVNYYNRHKQLAYTDYYVAKQNVSNKRAQYNFTLGYLGQGQTGAKLVRNSDVTTMGQRFKHSPHYHLTIGKQASTITGPQAVTINAPSSATLPTSEITGGNPSRVPTTAILKCTNDKQPLIRFIKISVSTVSANS